MTAEVDALVAGLAHPLEAEIGLVRRWMLEADPSVSEAVKWRAPSFRTAADFFATVHLRERSSLTLVFHTGARVKATAVTGLSIEDPTGLLRWLAPDRALVSLGAGDDLRARGPALQALVRRWIALVPE